VTGHFLRHEKKGWAGNRPKRRERGKGKREKIEGESHRVPIHHLQGGIIFDKLKGGRGGEEKKNRGSGAGGGGEEGNCCPRSEKEGKESSRENS